MMDKQNQDNLNSFIPHKYIDSNKAVLDLTNIIRTVVKSCIPLINISSEAKPKINKTELENDKLLRSSKREFNKAKRRFKENRHNNERRKEYRKIKYYILNCKKQNQLIKFAEIQAQDPKLFWKCIKKITRKKLTENPNITLQEWINYFNNLLNIKGGKKVTQSTLTIALISLINNLRMVP